MVTFSFLNLAEDAYPSPVNNTNAMDVVLCRNVLMYFTQEHAARVVENLQGSLVENGWLLVAPSETSQVVFRNSRPSISPTRYSTARPPERSRRLPSVEMTPVVYSKPLVIQEEIPSRDENRREEQTALTNVPKTESPIFLALALANHGELAEALAWCDRAVSSDALNPAHRFLRAMVAQELGSSMRR